MPFSQDHQAPEWYPNYVEQPLQQQKEEEDYDEGIYIPCQPKCIPKHFLHAFLDVNLGTVASVCDQQAQCRAEELISNLKQEASHA